MKTRTAVSLSRKQLDAAYRIVAESGLKGLSLKPFEARGNTPSSLTLHALILALVDESQTVWVRKVALVQEASLQGEFGLIRLFDEISGLFQRDPEVMRGRLLLLFELIGSGDPDFKDAVIRLQSSMQSGLESILLAGMKSRHFRTTNAHTLAVLINGACRGVAYQWVLAPDSIDLPAVFRELENLLVRAISD